MKNLKMNCRILVSTLLITGMMMCTDVVFGQVVSDFEDAGCPTPSADAQGDCSAAIGSEAIVTGDLSVAVGRGASVSGFSSGAFGSAARAAGDNAIAVGDAQANGNLSSAFGQRAIALGERGMAIGNSVRTTATTSNNFIFGSGYDVGILENDISNSIMIGVNSNVSTMFIGNSGGTTGSFGNVGIGNITAPASLLHVRDEVRLGLTGSANGSLIFNNSAGDTISFNTPASMSDQNYTLPTALGVNGDVLTYTTGGQLTWTNGGTATDDWRLDGNNNATSSSKLGTLNAQPLMIYANGLERMRVTTNGNVGIGITSPSVLLHLQATAASGNGEPLARFTVSDNSSGLLQFENRTSTNDEFAPSILGISTLADSEGLHLTGRFDSGNDSGTTPAMTFDARIVGNTNITARPLFRWRRASGTLMQMDASGNLGIGTTTPQGKLDVNGSLFAALATGSGNPVHLNIDNQLVENTSTINHKTNVEDLVFDREAFFSLRPVSYKWKEAHGGHQDIGLIAEEVEQIMPNMVNYGYKRTYIDEVTGELLRDSMGVPVIDTTQLQPWGVDYRKISIYLMALAKEQDERLNALESALEQCCHAGSPQFRMDSGNPKSHENEMETELKVYPNPNDGNFTVNYALQDGVAANLYLITTSGQKMLLSQNIRSSGKEVFNISGPSGVYHLVLEGSDSKPLNTVKIVVSR